MMRYCLFLTLVCLTLTGCASRSGTVLHGPQAPNLALGPTADHAWLAQQVGPRSDWPAVSTGLRLQDVTYYDSYLYDRESHYNRYGGTHHSRETYRTGVWIR